VILYSKKRFQKEKLVCNHVEAVGRKFDAMFQERHVAAIVRSTYEIDRGTQVRFQCRKNLAFDKNGPYFATGITPRALARFDEMV
jgi:hypothetical protein